MMDKKGTRDEIEALRVRVQKSKKIKTKKRLPKKGSLNYRRRDLNLPIIAKTLKNKPKGLF